METTEKGENRRSIVLLVVLCVPLFLVGLGHYDLDLKAEPREGVTAWEALHSGDFLLPHLNGELLPEKPLVFPWLVSGSLLVFGEGNNFAVRFPSTIAATAVVLLVFGIGRRLYGRRGGFLAATACATTALVVSLARRSRVDMTLTAFVCAALYFFLREFQRAEADPHSRPSPLAVTGFWLSLALGTLTKGPLGAILPSIVIASFLVISRRLRFVFRLKPLLGIPLYLTVAGSWYAYGLWSHGPDFAYRSFLMENVLMFLGSERGGGHVHGFFYLFPYYLSSGFPWSFYLPAALWLGFRRIGFRQTRFLFPLLWFAAMLLFFSIGSGKRSDYLLPVLPAAALLVGALWAEAVRDPKNAGVRRALLASHALPALLAVIALVAMPVLLAVPADRFPPSWSRQGHPDATLDVFREISEKPWNLGIAGLSLVLIGLTPLVFVWRGRPIPALGSVVFGFVAAVLLATFSVMPEIERRISLRPFSDEIDRQVGTDSHLWSYQAFEYQLIYYLRRRVPSMSDDAFKDFVAGAEPGYCVVTRRTYRDVSRLGEAPQILAESPLVYPDPLDQHLLIRAAPAHGPLRATRGTRG
jgi:4-amino-4-deoxy-L-arabinose transferase-like glycosyltransferase